MNSLIKLDHQLFYLINGKWTNSLFDYVMPLIRAPQLWVPLYVFLVVFVLTNFKKNVFWWILFLGCTALLSDFISSDLIKGNFFRLRPINNPYLEPAARSLLTYKPQSSSFTSSHAVNHFSLATFFYFTMKKHIGNWAKLFFLWAGIIIYAQVYVGVHFPLDVICGAMVGILFGYLSSLSYNKNYGLA
ncbi:MAG: phosphatase PAP2 family protein [Ferruginibacter sp.]